MAYRCADPVLAALEQLDDALAGEQEPAALLPAIGAAVGAPVVLCAGHPPATSSSAPVSGPGVPLHWLVADAALDATRREVLEQAAALLSLRLVREQAVLAIRRSHATATATAAAAAVGERAGAGAGPDGSPATRADALGIDLRPLAVDAGVVSFADSLLRPLVEHDRTRGSDLVGTLRAYLRTGGCVAETARRLDVHVNTLRHRIVRVRELGVELADPRTRFGLDLALRLRTGPL